MNFGPKNFFKKLEYSNIYSKWADFPDLFVTDTSQIVNETGKILQKLKIDNGNFFFLKILTIFIKKFNFSLRWERGYTSPSLGWVIVFMNKYHRNEFNRLFALIKQVVMQLGLNGSRFNNDISVRVIPPTAKIRHSFLNLFFSAFIFDCSRSDISRRNNDVKSFQFVLYPSSIICTRRDPFDRLVES